ncbi:MAG TPA: OB-fold nucleic acid binding domain-containing protein, partial [Thermoanaerobaculia bacterium]
MSDEQDESPGPGPADSGHTESSGEPELLENRRKSLREIAGLVGLTYPFSFPITATVSEIVARHADATTEALEKDAPVVATAGRILARRIQGKAGFLDLSDGRERLQIYVRRDAVTPRDWDLFLALDLGDWLGVEGAVFRTRTGQLSVRAEKLAF